MHKVGFDTADTDGCCGVTQITRFTEEDSHWDYESYGDTQKEACESLFTKLTSLSIGYVYQMWFVKYARHDGTLYPDFEAEPLRELVRNMEGCICLGTTVNPNSGNTIEGYQWIGK